MNNVIKADDDDSVSIELGALTKYMPMTSKMVSALLSLRGDNSNVN